MWRETDKGKYRRTGDCLPSDLTDPEWERLAQLIPPAKPGGRPRKTDMRSAMNAIFDLLRTGCPWRCVPRGCPSCLVADCGPHRLAPDRPPEGPCPASTGRLCSVRQRSLRAATDARPCARRRRRSSLRTRAGSRPSDRRRGGPCRADGKDQRAGRHGHGRSTGRSAEPCRSARSRMPPDDRQQRQSWLEPQRISRLLKKYPVWLCGRLRYGCDRRIRSRS